MLTKSERAAISHFRDLRIPEIYKIDKTDNILYVEHVIMDICPSLLRRRIRSFDIEQEKKMYAAFLASISLSEFDNYAHQHLEALKSVLNILFSYCAF